MHISRQKKECPKCQKNISFSNFNRHSNSCSGKTVTRSIWRCEICTKEFSTVHGYVGHKSRSHNPGQQRQAGIKGNKKKREMEANGHKFTFSMPDAAKEKLSILACERLAKHSKYSKNVEYKPGVILESSYEVRTAEILDSLGVKWEKVRRGYIWDDNGKTRRYVPDFYLPEQGIFLDPKNDYLIKKDQRKIDSACKLNNIKVLVLPDKDINKDTIQKLLL